MRKLSFYSLVVLLSSFLMAPLASAYSGPSQANAAPDVVYVWSDSAFDGIGHMFQYTDAATDTTSSLPVPSSVDSAVYMGYSQPFDGTSMIFDVEVDGATAFSTGTGKYNFEYWNGSAWTDLPLSTTNVVVMVGTANDLANGSGGTFLKEWERPSDWTTETRDGGAPYYYVRLLITEEYSANASISQIGLIDNDLDTDGDGLSDSTETTLGTDSTKQDTDGDSVYDGAEVEGGTDPLDANDFLADGNDYYLSCESPFTDTFGHWAEKSICLLYADGVVVGRSATTFAPNESITRAEFTKVALLNAGYTVPSNYTSSTGDTFSDVSVGAWYAPYVGYAQDHGFIEGYEDGTFAPDASINRAEAVIILLRVAGEVTSGPAASGFSDVNSDDWFAGAVAKAVDEGLVEGYGDGSFKPANEITRAEVSVVARRDYYVHYQP